MEKSIYRGRPSPVVLDPSHRSDKCGQAEHNLLHQPNDISYRYLRKPVVQHDAKLVGPYVNSMSSPRKLGSKTLRPFFGDVWSIGALCRVFQAWNTRPKQNSFCCLSIRFDYMIQVHDGPKSSKTFMTRKILFCLPRDVYVDNLYSPLNGTETLN